MSTPDLAAITRRADIDPVRLEQLASVVRQYEAEYRRLLETGAPGSDMRRIKNWLLESYRDLVLYLEKCGIVPPVG